MKRLWSFLVGFLLFVSATWGYVFAQGCAQCLDNAAATPPQTQRAYRQAIELLAGAALVIGIGVIAVARRER